MDYRLKVAQELLETEKTYLQGLDTFLLFHDELSSQLKNTNDSKKRKQLTVIVQHMGFIGQIRPAHLHIVEALKTRINGYDAATTTFGDVFATRGVVNVKAYCNYIRGCPRAACTHTHARSKVARASICMHAHVTSNNPNNPTNPKKEP
jgi:hypothetical protein